MKKVIIESPFAGDRARNRQYLLACMRDSLLRGEAPFASHLIYTQMLDDDVPAERAMGIVAGLAWGEVADATVVYTDLGISQGMAIEIERARECGRRVIYRTLKEMAKFRQETCP